MTLKEMFKKIEAYNEMAPLMGVDKAELYFCDEGLHSGESFADFSSLRKYIRREYIKEVADFVLTYSEYEFDKEMRFEWRDCFGFAYTSVFSANLCAA